MGIKKPKRRKKSAFETTQSIEKALRPYADEVYREVFAPVDGIKRSSEGGKIEKEMDKRLGIDGRVYLKPRKSRGLITFQEKLRAYDNIEKYGADFTQETKNGDGTLGEWRHLAAQFYMEGFGTPGLDGLYLWYILDVFLYRMLVHRKGGLIHMSVDARIRKNKKWGGAWFWQLDFLEMQPAIVAGSNNLPKFWAWARSRKLN